MIFDVENYKDKITLVTTKDTKLSDYRTSGIYCFETAYKPTDLPKSNVGSTWGWLIVIGKPGEPGGTRWVEQIYITSGSEIFFRKIQGLSTNIEEWTYIPSWSYITDNIYKKTEVNSMLNNHLLVKSFDVSLETLAAAGAGTAYGTFDTNIATSGYTPVGVVGFNSNGTNGTSMTYGEMYISGSKLYVLARNTNSGKACDSTSKVNVQVLYTKNS